MNQNKKSIIVLGAGLVGSPMAADLASDPQFHVAVADFRQEPLDELKSKYNIETFRTDLSDTQTVKSLIAPFDIVLDAVPGYLGFQTFKTIIECGKNVVDIAFFPEDPFQLNDLALENNVTAIMDMGVAPGMSNVLIGYAHHLLDETEKASIYVGGLPRIRQWPYEYKAVFSPADVLEEYTRPARFVRNGKLVEMPALTEPELMNFDGVGTLEAFNSDGLRSLFLTINAPDLIERTLRYPGHIEIMRILRDTGFFSKETMEINGNRISPLDFTSRLLFSKWKLEKGEEDITVMQVNIEGIKDGQKKKYTYDLLDLYNPETQVHSMARTTGYSATAAIRMLIHNLFDQKGVIVPEYIGKKPDCVRFLLDELKKRGVVYRETILP